LGRRIGRQFTRFSTFWVLTLYVGCALLITWPLVLHFDRAVVGDLESDVWKHLWGFWWMRQRLVGAHVLPLYTSLLNYPYGGSLFFIDPLGGLLALPLQSVLTPAEAFNLVVLFNIVLACAGAYALAHYLCKSLPAAFVAGVAYGCSPYLLSNITSGISESFNIGWIPLFVLYYTRALKEPGLGNPVKAGLLLALATIGCWYYGAFCVVYAAFYFLHVSIVHFARKAGRGNRVRRLLAALRVPVGLALAFYVLDSVRAVALGHLGPSELFARVCGASAAGLLLLCLLVGWRRTENPPPPLRTVVLRFVAQTSLTFAAWVLILLVRRASVVGWSGAPRFVSLGVLALSAAFFALVLWQNNADMLLAARIAAVRRLLRRLFPFCLAAVLCGLTAAARAVPVDNPVPSALVAVGWLICIALAWRARDEYGESGVPTREGPTPLERGRELLLCLLGGLVFTWFLVPPHPLIPLALSTLTLLLLRHLPGMARLAALRVAAWIDEAASALGAPGLVPDLRAFARTVLLRALIVAAVSGALVLPVAYVFKHTLNSQVSIVFRDRNKMTVDFHLSEEFHNIARLADYVTPGKSASVRTYTVDRLTRVCYAGYLLLGLALLAVGLRRRGTGWWVGVAVVSVTFSLGPFLYVTSGIHLPVGEQGRFPPYMWMYEWFPFFSQVSIPFRFDAVAMMAFSVLAAYTLSGWMRGRPLETRMLLALSVSLAILLEVMLISPAPFPLPLASLDAPPAIAGLAQDPDACALLDLPIQRYEGELLPGEYFYYQMLHGKSIPNRVEGEIPEYVFTNRFMLQLFHLEHDWSGYPNDNEKALRASLGELRDFRFKYFVVHERLFRPGAGERVNAMLRHFLGAPRSSDGEVTIYQVYRPDGTDSGLAPPRPLAGEAVR
jgi:hypothetical protein